MNKDEIKTYLSGDNYFTFDDDQRVRCISCEETNNYLQLEFRELDEYDNVIKSGKYITFPIVLNISYQVNNFIQLKNIQGNELGYIYTKKAQINPQDVSIEFYAAFLHDAQLGEIENQDFSLKNSYLVLNANFLEEYVNNYKKSSVLWGGFYHNDNDDKQITDPLPQTKTEIICLPKLELPTKFHQENAQRAIIQPYAFERFLKNYHLLELLFDYKSIEEISQHHQNRAFQKAGDVLKKYKREDIDRLMYIVEKCNDIEKIASLLNEGKNFQNILFDMLYSYEKTNSVLKEDFNKIMLESYPFSIESINKYNIQVLKNNRNKKLQEFTSYCIYRIRSSIAHSKIGEFLLTSSDPEHEEFMVKFAEPLLQEVLIQCFTQNP